MEDIILQEQKKAEKKQIKKAANLIGAAYSAMLAVSGQLQIIFMIALLLFGMTMQQMEKFLADNTVLLLMQIIISALMFTLPYIIVMKIGKIRVGDIAAFRRPKKKLFWPLVAVGMGVCTIGELTTNMFTSALWAIGIEPSYSMGFEFSREPLQIVLIVLAVSVLPALVEEFALRGIVMGSLRRFGDGFAIVFSAAMFGIMHGNLVQIPFAFVVGLGLGFIAIKSGSVWTCCLVHFINNLSSVVMTYIFEDMSVEWQNFIYVALGAFWLILGIIGIIIAARRDEELFKFEKGELKAKNGEKAKWAVTAPFIIISLAVTALEIVAAEVLL